MPVSQMTADHDPVVRLKAGAALLAAAQERINASKLRLLASEERIQLGKTRLAGNLERIRASEERLQYSEALLRRERPSWSVTCAVPAPELSG